MYKIILSTLLIIASFNVQAENRFSMGLEYELMSYCVGGRSSIAICKCALTKTMEGSGFFSSYKKDKDYRENVSKFNKSFSKNRDSCRK